jgi:tRNA 2-thiouridine synthesizing protein A
VREEGGRLDSAERDGDRLCFRLRTSAKPPHS